MKQISKEILWFHKSNVPKIPSLVFLVRQDEVYIVYRRSYIVYHKSYIVNRKS